MARSVEFVGIQRTQGVLRDMRGRFATQAVFLETRMIPLLEANEAELFAAWGGRFNSQFSGRSWGGKLLNLPPGALMMSLTRSDATGAIRKAHAHSIEFGSSLFYGYFQRALGGPSGKPRGRTRIGPSLVLALKVENMGYIAQMVNEYLFSGFTDAGEESYSTDAMLVGA